MSAKKSGKINFQSQKFLAQKVLKPKKSGSEIFYRRNFPAQKFPAAIMN